MLPFRRSNASNAGDTTNNNISRQYAQARSFTGFRISTYGRIHERPAYSPIIANAAFDNALTQLGRRAGNTNAPRTSGLPEGVEAFLLDLTFIDLIRVPEPSEEDQDDTHTTNNQTALVPSNATAPTSATVPHKYEILTPCSIRPHARPRPERLEVLSSCTELIPYQPFRPHLLALPLEIRELIYTHLLHPTRYDSTTVLNNHLPESAHNNHLLTPTSTTANLTSGAHALQGGKSLLALCKQTRVEIASIFCARYTWTFSNLSHLLPFLTPLHQPLGTTLSLRSTHLIHLDLHTNTADFNADSPASSLAFARLCMLALALLPKLRTVTLSLLPASISPPAFTASKDPNSTLDPVSKMDTWQCMRLTRYGLGTGRDASYWDLDVWGLAGDMGVPFFRVGEMLQGKAWGGWGEEWTLFGGTWGNKRGGLALGVMLELVGERKVGGGERNGAGEVRVRDEDEVMVVGEDVD